MMRMTQQNLSRAIAMFLLAGTALAQTPAPQQPANASETTGAARGALDAAISLMAGAFSSTEQAAADKDYFDIRLHMVPIWPAAKEGKWLYVEQAMAGRLEQPYRQRIYHVTALADGTIKSEVYMLPGEALKFAGAWKKPESFDVLKPEELKLKDGCAVLLKKGDDGAYVGGTQGKSCASDLRGAAYATSQVHMDAKGLITWDRGYDKDGNQVWGAEKGGYHFKRVTVEESIAPPAPGTGPKLPPAPSPTPAPVPQGEPKPMKPELVHPPQDLVPPANPK